MINSKRICAAALLLAVLVAAVSAQNNAISESTEFQETQTVQTVDESTLPINSADGNFAGTQSAASSFWLFLRMIIVLAVVVACIYGVMWFMKRGMKTENNTDPFLRRVSSVSVSAGKTVQIVTLLDHAYIIGVADDSINLIGEVSDKELIDAMNLYADRQQNTKKPRSFSDILDIFMPGGPRSKKDVFDDSAKKVADLLKKQRERLRDGE